MPFDVAIFGTLVFGPKEATTWKKALVDSSRWRSLAKLFPDAQGYPPISVSALLKELPAAGWHDLFRVERDGHVYRVRGRFAERPFRERARQLCALFMTAADVDARGDVYFLGEGVSLGYSVQLNGGKPQLAALDDDEVLHRSKDPELDLISGYFRVAPPSEPPPRPSAPPPPSSSGRNLLRMPPPSSDDDNTF